VPFYSAFKLTKTALTTRGLPTTPDSRKPSELVYLSKICAGFHLMAADPKKTDIYVACFHSELGQDIRGASGQFEIVEKAIQSGEWPYDNGDDPSFYQAQRRNPLTWGVCRQNVRNAIQKDDIVVFISFTKVRNLLVVYRLCSVATVASKMDHRYVWDDPRFKGKAYLNVLIEADPNKERWVHTENDRRRGARHQDWLWRITDHSEVDQKTFNRELKAVYEQGWFSNETTICGKPLRMAENYVVFSDEYIPDNPPEVAYASKGSCERWTDNALKQAIFRSVENITRTNIRTTNPSIAHPHIRWSLEPDQARDWKDNLIEVMKKHSS
jgi:hypothetical protein